MLNVQAKRYNFELFVIFLQCENHSITNLQTFLKLTTMTTKKFRLIEYSTDGSIFDENVYNTRKEATQVIANIMANDEHADPQLFKIQVEEVEVKTKTELLVEELVAKLKRYGDEWIVSQEENRAYISRTCGLWSSAVLMDIVEFMQQPEYADHGFHINREGMLVIYNPEED